MRPDEGAYGIHVLVHAHQQREIRRHHVGVRRNIDQQIGHMPLIRLAQQLLEGIAGPASAAVRQTTGLVSCASRPTPSDAGATASVSGEASASTCDGTRQFGVRREPLLIIEGDDRAVLDEPFKMQVEQSDSPIPPGRSTIVARAGGVR